MLYTGVDIGGTKCSVSIGDEKGRIAKKVVFNTTNVKDALRNIIAAVGEIGCGSAIGISCGGPLNSEAGIILSPPNLPGWDNVKITEILTREFNTPAFLKNDADACALAEWKFGAGKGTQNMIFLTFGTGMGAGIILNGRLYSGTCDMAGEIGHVRMENKGPVGYGKEGSFEGFCSGGGIAQMGVLMAKKNFCRGQKVSFCRSPGELESITAKSIAECADKGEEDALEIYKKCGNMLGRGLSILIDVLNPEMIVIGSIFARSEGLLRAEMEKVIKQECLGAPAKRCRIISAKLGEKLGDVAAISVAVNGMNGEMM